MSTVRLCGLEPLLFRRKSISGEWMRRFTAAKKSSKGHNEGKGESMEWSFRGVDEMILMMKVHKKIFVFRDIMDLSPLQSSASLLEMVITTLDDLQRLYPGIIQSKRVSIIKDNPIDQGLACFCEALKSLGESWLMDNDCKGNYELPSCKDNRNMQQLGETMLAMLDCLIKIASDKFDMMEENSPRKELLNLTALPKPFDHSFSCYSPVTPKSVLQPETMKYPALPIISYTTSSLLSLRIQALGKLNPIDLKRLSYHTSSPKNLDKDHINGESKSKRTSNDHEKKPYKPDQIMENVDQLLVSSPNVTISSLPPLPPLVSTPNVIMSPLPLLSPSSITSPNVTISLSLPPLPPLVSSPNIIISPPPISPSTSSLNVIRTSPLPPPLPSAPKLQQQGEVVVKMSPTPLPGPLASVLPPPPIPSIILKAGTIPAPPPPVMSLKPGLAAPAPPPPMPRRNGAGAPPTPPPGGAGRSLRPRATTKLKRSAQLGNLYRTLKRKVEGTNSNLKGKSSSGRSGIGARSNGGKQGMADALAEMAKRSSYFQQIEEDVQRYTIQIQELRSAISNFKTNDMTQLIKFHKDVESVLENLTDESQVLSRFEGFPGRKLEAIRMAAALYNKMDSILRELQNWNIVAPVNQVLDKVERYFDKIKTELDALERTKDEESKKFKGHNIEFDFHILVKIKEAMVDVSSSCMELALKERRNDGANGSEGKRKECAKLLWRAFQFAFRIYTFAGGHDDRAEKLTRELAEEIENDPIQP